MTWLAPLSYVIICVQSAFSLVESHEARDLYADDFCDASHNCDAN
jgi:hypothetical protein